MRLQEEGATVLSGGMDLKPITGTNGLVITPDTLIKSLEVDEAAFRDGNQVWGRVVADIPAFCRELMGFLESYLYNVSIEKLR